MRLEPIGDLSADAWNEAIAPYDTAMFYHHSAWLSFLEERGRGKAVRFRILDGAEPRGYFVAFLLRKGPFRILGSPLSASMSEYMGPIVDADFEVEQFLVSLDALCKSLRIHHVELGSPLLEPGVMRRHHYETQEWMTYRIPLSRDQDAMWTGLKRQSRNRIRRGLKNGLVVEDTRDPSFVDTHYSQVVEVFGRQGLAPPFAIEDFRALYKWLKPQDLVFSLEVKRQGTDDVIASGIFPHDSRHVYSLSTASRTDSRSLYPNELLHWTVMRLAGQRGLERYSIGDSHRAPDSGGKFKDKFRGDYVPVHRFRRNYSLLAKYSRQVYAAVTRAKQRFAWHGSR